MEAEPAKLTGFLLVNKPVGPTSHDVIARLRKITGLKKIGHAGTLDPFASGLLIVGIGRETTRELGRFVKLDKRYRAELRLGAISDTGDRTGRITETSEIKPPTPGPVKKLLNGLVGAQLQVPPMYSAKKVAGRKLYELARRGRTVKRDPVKITIYSLRLEDYAYPRLVIEAHCSSGTYIRALARDIGRHLGCGAYVNELSRLAVGPFSLETAVRLEDITLTNWTKHLKEKLTIRIK